MSNSADLNNLLAGIEPTFLLPQVPVYPAAATLHDGTVHECVYFMELCVLPRCFFAASPDDTVGLNLIHPGAIRSVAPSRARLPARFATQLYSKGETGMGYHVFEVRFVLGIRRRYLTGPFLDFLYYPLWLGPEHVRSVRKMPSKLVKNQLPTSYWCFF